MQNNETATATAKVDPTKWLSTNEVANIYGVSKKTVYGWIKAEKLHPYNVAGYLLRFNPAEVNALAQPRRTRRSQQTTQPTTREFFVPSDLM